VNFSHRRFVGFTLLAVASITGCAAPPNEEPVIFETRSYADDPDAPAVAVTGLSRDHWPDSVITLPHAEVAHQPAYVETLTIGDLHARRARKYPTIDTVLDMTPQDGSEQLEALLAYPHAGYLFLKAPVEMLQGDWPWTIGTSGPAHERVPGRE